MSYPHHDRTRPLFAQSDARYALVLSALTDEWQTPDSIGKIIKEVGEDVRYQLGRLVKDGKAERLVGVDARGRKRTTFRRIQIPATPSHS